MCPIDFGVKRSTVKVMAHGYLKMVHRNNGCRFEFVGVGGGPVLLQQYFQYAFICCPYMLPLLFFQFYKKVLNGYWETGRQHVENKYSDFSLPFPNWTRYIFVYAVYSEQNYRQNL